MFFRSSIAGVIINGWQAEIAPPKHDTGGVYESYGRGWLKVPDPEKDKYLNAWEWNDFEVRVIGDEITTWLNGHEMVKFKDEKIGDATGFIALQIHDMPKKTEGIKVRWKNILIKEE